MAEQQLDALEADVVPIIHQWATSKADEIIARDEQKGGWEGWAQVEIAETLDRYRFQDRQLWNRKHSDRVHREQPVYQKKPTDKGAKMADFVIGRNSRRVFEQRLGTTIMELKCEGLHNKDKFKKVVEQDIKKVTLCSLKPEYVPARVLILAISVSHSCYEEMSRAIHPDANDGSSICRYWLVRAFVGAKIRLLDER
jgi:hypothetical protein